MTTSKDRRVLRTKKNIRTAFLQLLDQKSPSQITVKELSQLADINRKTFYMYYTCLEDILDELEKELLDKLIFVFETQLIPISSIEGNQFFTALNQTIEEDFPIYHTLYHCGHLPAIVQKAKDALLHIILEEYQITASPDNERYALYAEYAAAGLLSMYSKWFQENSQLPLSELTELATEMIMYGFHRILTVPTQN